MYHGKESYNEKVDIFSFAMLIYEMITFRIPFEHLTPSQAIIKLMRMELDQH